MRSLTIIFLLTSFSAFCQNLEVQDLKNLTADETATILQQLKSNDQVLLFSKNADSQLLQLINNYRLSNSLLALTVSTRLDTLSKKVAIKNTTLPTITHFNKIPEIAKLNLLNLENIFFVSLDTYDSSRIGKRISYDFILQSWIDSPGHNKNLLKSFPNEVAATKIVVKVTKQNKAINYTVYAVFEIDDKLSNQELMNKFKEANKRK